MKRLFVLLVVALLSTVVMSAKTVRGYVSDQNGDPVVGVRMIVANQDAPEHALVVAETDEAGYFEIGVPDDLDVEDLPSVFAKRGAKVIKYWVSLSGMIEIVADPATMKR